MLRFLKVQFSREKEKGKEFKVQSSEFREFRVQRIQRVQRVQSLKFGIFI